MYFLSSGIAHFFKLFLRTRQLKSPFLSSFFMSEFLLIIKHNNLFNNALLNSASIYQIDIEYNRL